ncbi:MFS transporter [Hujiaoplasma nucleasis]|uniref:MFS transporter n=1 Tax=Hujiaoplasma nucleasis TaxID=2725268 RepID=A0A7L6N5H5_9MOLU|nr:MFS transporter [Hujiaoplasma nucleasis]QLY40742.1 MFS transporter [Hujiaoplasma nucleasis]
MNDKFKSNLRIFIIFGILFELMNVFYNPYAMKFLERIGGNEFHFSLINSTKGIIMIFTALPAAFIMNKIIDKQKATANIVLAMAIIIFSLFFIPLLPKDYQVMSFIVIITLLMIPIAVYNISYQNIIGEVFPVKRARVLAKRSIYTIIFTTIATISSGLVFRYFAQTNSDYILIYRIFYAMAFIYGVLAFLVFKKLYYKPTKMTEPLKFKGSFKKVFKNKGFTKFALSSTIFHFGWQMGWPLFSIYTIKTLGADEFWISIISVGSAMVMLVAHRIWPRLIEKYGNEKIAYICTFGMAITPLLYVISKSLLVLAIFSSLSGIFTAGTITVLFSDMLEVIPEKNRIIYVGYYNVLTNITLAISPFVGHYFYESKGIIYALIVTAIFRLIGGMAFMIRERSEHRYKMRKASS